MRRNEGWAAFLKCALPSPPQSPIRSQNLSQQRRQQQEPWQKDKYFYSSTVRSSGLGSWYDFWVFSLFLMGGGGGGRGGEREKTNMLEIAPEDPRRAIPLPDLKNFSSLLLFVFTLIGRSPPTEGETSEVKKADSTMKCKKIKSTEKKSAYFANCINHCFVW